MACMSGGRTDAASVPEQFPVGLRVLVVDDDLICLRILEQMLRRCLYEVTCCSRATAALNLLRERKDGFDIILSDVHMPDMDGFKLLELVGLEMDLPVVKAVPKRILELMNVPGLTRENVASHLQKFRLYLKRLSGVAQQQAGLPISYCGPVEQNLKLASLGRFDIQALAASGQFPPQTLAALHAELMSQPAGSLILPAMDQRTLLHESLQGSKCVPVDRNVAYGQPLIKCPPNPAKQTSQPGMSNEDPLSEFVPWSGDTMPACNLAPVIETNNNMLMSFIQQQQQQKQPAALEQGCLINVQPSCMVAPSQSSLNFHAGNRPIYMNQDCSFRNGAVDYANTSLQPNNLSGVGEVLNIESKPGNAGSGSSCSRTVQGSTCQRVPSSTPATVQVPNMNSVQGTNNSKPDMGHASARTPIYVGKKTSIPSRFAVDENELPMSNVSQVKLYSGNNGNKVKKEPTMVVSENVEVCSAEASSF